MHFSIQRESLLKPLQLVAGVVDRRQTLPILSNVLLVVNAQELFLTGTDLEVELVARMKLDSAIFEDGMATIPARKLMDICKSLPNEANLNIKLDKNRILIKSGQSRFSLSTLPVSDFPSIEEEKVESLSFILLQKELKRLVDHTSFAMAQQDVRYYLNGMLLELKSQKIRAVTTDGHRLALCSINNMEDFPSADVHSVQVIVPRKGILELGRLLTEPNAHVKITLAETHIRATVGDFTFTSKLVDGKFPDYERVLPLGGDKIIILNRLLLKEALTRAAILSNEKYRGIKLIIKEGLLKVQANNPDQEEAEEDIAIDYYGEPLEIGFNVGYLLDILNVMETQNVKITLSDSNSSALLQELDSDSSAYVVMPMRL